MLCHILQVFSVFFPDYLSVLTISSFFSSPLSSKDVIIKQHILLILFEFLLLNINLAALTMIDSSELSENAVFMHQHSVNHALDSCLELF